MAALGSSAAQPNAGQVNLSTLVAAIQQAVQAQNGIATAIGKVTTALNASVTAIEAQTIALQTAFPPPLTGSATWSPGLIATGASASTTITVAGATIGNYVDVAFDATLQGCTISGYVSGTNTVTVVITNNTGGGITPAASTVVTCAVTTTGV